MTYSLIVFRLCFGRAQTVKFIVWLAVGYSASQGSETASCEGEVATKMCESNNYVYVECRIPESRTIIGANVIIQHSKSACDFYNGTLPENYTGPGRYGFTYNVLWVHGGCRATFKICYVDRIISTTSNGISKETASSVQSTLSQTPTFSPLMPMTDTTVPIISSTIKSSLHSSTSSLSSLLTRAVHTSISVNTGATRKSDTDEPDKVPIAAVVVAPLSTVVIIGATVYLAIIWRKRKRKKTTSSKKIHATDATTHRRTNDYTSPDVCEDLEYSYASLNTNTDGDGTHNTLEEEEKNNLSSTIAPITMNNNSKILIISPGNVYSNADVAEANDRSDFGKHKGRSIPTAPPSIDTIAGKQTGQSAGGGEHTYFVLEQESLKTTVTPNTKLETYDKQSLRNQRTNGDQEGQAKVDRHGYLIIEPVDTYTTINPDDVIIQTLSDDEYNVVDMKPSKPAQAGYYDTLKQPGSSLDGDEYSHTSDVKVKTNEMDYAHLSEK